MESLRINNPQVVSKSYPKYWEHLKAAGYEVESEE
jgi:3-phosphoshikimate 1-carboxyvinyltransferase